MMFPLALRSLRFQILVGMAASIVLMFIFSTLALHFVLRYHIYDQFYNDLGSRARTLAKYVEFEHGELSFEWAHYDAQSTMLPSVNDGTGCIFTVWRAPDEVMAEINIFENLHIRPDYDLTSKPGDPPRFKPITLPDGSQAWQVSFRFEAVREDSDPVIGSMPRLGITVVRRTVSVEQTMSQIDSTLVVVTTATMLLSMVGMWLLIRWGLAPLEPVLAQLKTIGTGDLSQRVDPGNLPREMVAIIRTLNDLLAALEIKVARERRFVANAAHELRNPITAVRANLEVALLNSDNPQLGEDVARSSLEAATHLQFVCERLLSLAGLQESNVSIELQDVDVAELVNSILDDMADPMREMGMSIVWTSNAAVAVQTDPVLLNVIFSNLLRNAIAYGKAGEPVYLAYEAADETVKFTVRNGVGDGQRLEMEKVMEPFWRGEESRSLGEGHLGLGLTIVQSAVDQLHGSMSCSLEATRSDSREVEKRDAAVDRQIFVASITLPRQWPGRE